MTRNTRLRTTNDNKLQSSQEAWAKALEESTDPLETMILLTVGAGSTSWKEQDGEIVFDSESAINTSEIVYGWITDNYEKKENDEK